MPEAKLREYWNSKNDAKNDLGMTLQTHAFVFLTIAKQNTFDWRRWIRDKGCI